MVILKVSTEKRLIGKGFLNQETKEGAFYSEGWEKEGKMLEECKKVLRTIDYKNFPNRINFSLEILEDTYFRPIKLYSISGQEITAPNVGVTRMAFDPEPIFRVASEEYGGSTEISREEFLCKLEHLIETACIAGEADRRRKELGR